MVAGTGPVPNQTKPNRDTTVHATAPTRGGRSTGYSCRLSFMYKTFGFGGRITIRR